MDEWVCIKDPKQTTSAKSLSFLIIETDTRVRELNRTKNKDVSVPRVYSKRKESTLSTDSSITEPKNLEFFSSALFATALEDVLQCIYILGECNNELRIQKTLASYNALHKAKFGIKPSQTHANVEEPVSIESKEISILRKMAADKHIVAETIRNLYVEITTNGTFKSLKDKIEEFTKSSQLVQTAQEELAQMKLRYLELKRQLRRKKNVYKTRVYHYNNAINKLKDDIEDYGYTHFTRMQYTQKWQRSRCEQLARSIEEDDAVCLNSIKFHKSKIEIESRVHNETCHYYNIKLEEDLDAIEEIMLKYDVDMEAKVLECQIANKDYKDMLDLRIELETRYKKREQEIRNCVELKLERVRQEQYAQKMKESAIIVQAWWRGLLVRLQLGPYRPKKKRMRRKKRKSGQL